jgi:ubiquitin
MKINLAIFFALTLLLVHGPFLVAGFSVLVRGPQFHLRLSRTQLWPLHNSGGRGGWSQEDYDNYADQMNPNNDEYAGGDDDYQYTQDDLDNHADQMNPNNDEYGGGN